MSPIIRSRTRRSKPGPLSVTHDNDGGITVRDHRSGLVFSIIGTNPQAVSETKGVYIEVYPYESSKFETYWEKVQPTISRHPTFFFTAIPRPEEEA